jgi:hypothetical protein
MIRIYNRIIVDVQRQLTKPRLFCQEAVIHPSTGALRYAADKHCDGGIVTREETALRIDSEFESLCPPLTPDEYEILEASIVSEGCRDALVVWDSEDILLDGHNRRRICEQYGLAYDTVTVELPDRQSAIDWIILNQLGRRNLHPDAASLLRGRLYNSQKQAPHSGENQYTRGEYQNDTHQTTAARLSSQLGVSAPTIKRDGKFAEAVDILKPVITDIQEQVMSGAAYSRQAIIEASKTPETALHVLISQSNSNEWYTPPEYIEAARQVMGAIDLDPASNNIAQDWIKAETFYTKNNDGLSKDWRGRVWLNPPWGRLTGDFIAKLMTEYEAGNIQEAVILVNAHATDTRWFDPLWNGTLCFTNHRINYKSGRLSDILSVSEGSTHGSVFVYFGKSERKFIQAFRQWGAIVKKVCDQ